ncbi:hypothetical protein B0J14DRAFT_566408 [Halenospora varia]|nr:hypothetical protein B0J14DRAFT_566408 [Halenospora varia]
MLNNGAEGDSSSSSTEQGQSTAATSTGETAIPPIDTQIKTVTTLIEAARQTALEDEQKAYLISMRWLKRVQDRGSEARQHSKVELEGEIGPVDNSDIIQQIITTADGNNFVQLKNGITEDQDFVFCPEDAWNLVVEWYGIMPGTIAIERFTHNTNPDKTGLPNVVYELHPPVFTIHRLWSEHSGIPIQQKLKASNPAAPVFVFSRATRYYDFLKAIKEKAGIDLSKKVRIWRVPRLLPASEPTQSVAGAATPPSSRPGTPGPAPENRPREPQDSWTSLLLDTPSFVMLEKGNGRELVEKQDITADSKYNGSSDLQMTGLGDTQTVVIDEATSATGSHFVSNTVPSKGSKNLSASLKPGVTHSAPSSGRSSPTPSGPMTRGRTQRSGRAIGTVGLSNLGNTCYMNSALQCVRSVEELTKYFLTGESRKELNKENPLGNHGEVAIAYMKLLEEIYRDPVPLSVQPRQFKNTIGRFAPSFSGYGQQDTQEFLGFLLDGLQEDLSRIKKKPYIEKPDSTDEMVNNPEAIREMAAKVWDITKKRDDSVIADLFTGMYKSTLVCPVCAKVSITFDPFNNLTLQLPIESSWTHQIFYFPLNDSPVRMTVDIGKQASILAMKEFVSTRVGVPTDRLFAVEHFKGKFYKIYSNFDTASEEVGTNDHVWMYELETKPTNWPAPHKPAKPRSMLAFGSADADEVPEDYNSPLAEKMLVPVIHRTPGQTERYNRFSKKQWSLTTAPHFIIVTPEEARDEDIIKRKILEKVANFTTHHIFTEDEADASVTDSVDPDIVLTTGSDADSSGGSKVIASSVDGEDELVDVTMRDSAAIKSSQAKEEPAPLKSFNTRRPKFMTPGSFLKPDLQQMFRLHYFGSGKELIPNGWNIVDEDKNYPTLESRAPKTEETTNGFDMTNGRASSHSSDEDNFEKGESSIQTRMNDESSEEDELAQAPKALPLRQRTGVRVGHNKRRTRGIKTYSRKGDHQATKFHNSDEDMEEEEEEEEEDLGPLIRLGEGIVVDWQQDAHEALYDGDSPEDTMRGYNLTANPPELPDPALQAKQNSRARRRKDGITMDDCLNEFGKEEILSEQDTWYCPRCKEHRRASKKFELWKTPDILVMHLKRFSSAGFRRDKLDVVVDFPIEGLDLTSRVIETEEGKNEIYDLFAVDNHFGGLGGGHYTAMAKNFFDGEWYDYNDSSVSKMRDPTTAVSRAAYLLFYRRRSNLPLGGPRFEQIFRNFDKEMDPQDDDAEEDSGEEQGLVGNTYLRGSSSALTGVGAAHHRPNLGGDSEMMTVHPASLESLPAYQAHENMDDDSAPLLVSDTIQNTIEEDEGIDMGMNYSNVEDYESPNNNNLGNPLQGNWSFGGLDNLNTRGQVSGTGSDIDGFDDAASDIVNNNSSAGPDDLADRLREFNETEPLEFEEQPEIPDLDETGQASQIAIHHEIMEKGFNILAGETFDEADESATEIHIADNVDFSFKSEES